MVVPSDNREIISVWTLSQICESHDYCSGDHLEQFERIEAYPAPPGENSSFQRFKVESQNSEFRRSRLTIVSLLLLLVIYPLLTFGFSDDPTAGLKELNEGTRIVLLVATVVMQWSIFLLLYVAVFREGTSLSGLGFRRIMLVDFYWAFAFLLGANLILSGLAWMLEQVGLPMPGEISFLIPTDTPGRILWVLVSFTAGFCEETAFRGYLMTRMRLLGKFQSWAIPAVVSAVVFGALHSYQGVPGMIIISTYGLMFSILFIRTGRIWPGIIAHFFQDFGALFFPQ